MNSDDSSGPRAESSFTLQVAVKFLAGLLIPSLIDKRDKNQNFMCWAHVVITPT